MPILLSRFGRSVAVQWGLQATGGAYVRNDYPSDHEIHFSGICVSGCDCGGGGGLEPPHGVARLDPPGCANLDPLVTRAPAALAREVPSAQPPDQDDDS